MESTTATGTGSLLINLKCPACGTEYDAGRLNTICLVDTCKSSLFAQYDLNAGLNKAILNGRGASMWRYRELLPVLDPENIVTLEEGFTPIIPLTNLKLQAKNNTVFWKDESGNPTGSFKARGMSMAVSKAKELGVKAIATPTAGNAGGALSAYGARAGIKAVVYMPKLTPQVFKDECRLYGAELVEVDGNIADCGKLINEQAEAKGWFQIPTLKEPYRLEGKKTLGLEIAEQFNWELPDVILYPTGGGTGLIGIWKAFNELEQLGWIGSKRPRMVSVQSESCNGIVTAFHGGQATSEFTDGGFTIANGLRVPKPYADKLVLQVLRDSNGTALSISDGEMDDAIKEIARNEGMLMSPEGASLWQAFKKLQSSGWITKGETILLVNTGSGYKYLENIQI
jgi:threonine synthase